VTCLVDTHIFLWVLQDSNRLSKKTRALLGSRENELRLSAISLIEISIKVQLQKLKVAYDHLEVEAKSFGLRIMPLLPAHARAFHDIGSDIRDPFDRMLLATAIASPMYFLTADANLCGYSDLVIEA